MDANLKMRDSKAMGLISLLTRSPAEFRDRALMIASSRLSLFSARQRSYVISDWKSAVEGLGNVLGSDFERALDNQSMAEVESQILARQESMPPQAPFGRFHNGDLALARFCYAAARTLRPDSIIETGVCYGVTSAFLLAALQRNHRGSLHSIDLPPLGRDADRFVGWAIPDDSLKARWQLHRGASRRVLRTLVEQVGQVDLFVHDSLHTYGNMRMEFDLVWPRLRPGGVLISDDIEGNDAFRELTERYDVAFYAVLRELEKESLLGVAVKQS